MKFLKANYVIGFIACVMVCNLQAVDQNKIAVVGAGLMGHGIGKNVLEKGFALVTMAHRNREPVEDLVKRE